MKTVQIVALVAIQCAVLLNLVQSIDVSGSDQEMMISWEAEAGEPIEKPLPARNDPKASAGRYVALYLDRQIRYQIVAEEIGDYTLWARTKWVNACRDSLQITVNGDPPTIFGNDSLYGTWHWIKGNVYRLHRGINIVSVEGIASRLVPVQVDQFLLTNRNEADVRAFLDREFPKSHGILLSENFSGNWQQHWTPAGGRWELRDPGALMYLEQTTHDRALLLAGEPHWTDYAVQAALRLARGGMQGLVFGYADGANYALARLVHEQDGQLLQVVQIADGRQRVLAEKRVKVRPQTWVSLRIELLGSALQVFLNESRSIYFLNGTPMAGRMGLFSDRVAGTAFDDVEVRSIAALSESAPLGRGSTPDRPGTEQIDGYSYSPWRAPVGWEAARGTIEMGHVFLSARDASGEGLLWNQREFPCRDALYEFALLIRGDAAPGAHIELILCNQGSAAVNGTRLRVELVDEPPRLLFEAPRTVQLTLARGGKVLGRGAFVVSTNRTGFVTFIIGLKKAGQQTQVFANRVNVLQVADLALSDAGKVGLRFAALDPDARDVLGLGFFRVFP